MGRQGANYTGSVLEVVVWNRLVGHGYQFVDKPKFKAARYLEQPIYSAQVDIAQVDIAQVDIGVSIYGTKRKCDFAIYHPEKWPEGLLIECKWQQMGGSADEKFPLAVLNIKMQSPYKSYKKSAEQWMRNQVDGKLLHVFNMSQFQTWVNSGNI
jgi:hypothetical protein